MIGLALCGVGVALALLLGGCATHQPTSKRMTIDGIKVVLHVGHTDVPGNCHFGIYNGCHMRIGDEHHIWLHEFSPDWVWRHEFEGHAKGGMRHTDWVYNRIAGANCATVTVPTKGYPMGATICVTQTGEQVF